MRGDATIEELQRAVLEVVEKEVPPGTRLRMLGIPKGDPSLPLSELKLKAPSRLVTMPSPSHIFGRHAPTPTRAYEWLQERVDSSHACVLRDADEDPVSWSDDEAFERRVKLRIKNYKGYIRLAPMDTKKKKVLVLDLDFTAMDTAIYNADLSATPRKWRRPFLAELCASVFPFYNLVVWSATGNAFVESKLYEMGLLTDPRFVISLLIDYGAMVRVKLRRHGGQVKEFNTKPLSVMWGKWPKETNADNTVIVDDHRRSFLLNAPNGIHVTVSGIDSHKRHAPSSPSCFVFLPALPFIPPVLSFLPLPFDA